MINYGAQSVKNGATNFHASTFLLMVHVIMKSAQTDFQIYYNCE